MKNMSAMGSCVVMVLCLALFVPALAVAAQKQAGSPPPEAPTASVSLEFGQGGFILSASGGKGMLRFKGRKYPIKIGSVGFGGIGVSKIVASGEVYNLKRVEDFPGAYAQARVGYAAGTGKGVQWLENANGVRIKLRTTTKGASLNLGADGMLIEFGTIKK